MLLGFLGLTVLTLAAMALVARQTAPRRAVVPLPTPASEPASAPPETSPAPAFDDTPVRAELGERPGCLLATTDEHVIASHAPDTPVTPASTQKILVAAAALELFGPQHRFVTEVVADVRPVDGIVDSLWLVGGADPFLVTPDYAAHLADEDRWEDHVLTPLGVLAERLVNAGVREVRGGIHGDDSRHDRLRYLSSWPPRYLGTSIAPMSALTLDHGWAQWEGQLRPAEDPAAHAAAELARLLRDRGVRVAGEGTAAEAPQTSVSLAAASSAPLVETLPGVLRASDNQAAELLTREIGLERLGVATTDAGTRAVSETLGESAVDVRGVDLVDGSGLDPGNRLTCRSLVDTLSLEPAGVALPGLLAVAGHTGTLRDRFEGTLLSGRLYGKTGWVAGTVGMAGVMNVADGAVFAVLQNEIPGLREAQDVEERLLVHIAEHLQIGHN